MRQPFWIRVLALLPALWLPLVVGEPGIADPCPMHGSVAGHAVHRDAAVGEPYTPASHVDPRGMASAHPEHGTHRAPPVRHEGHQCTCIGCCSASTPLRAPEATELASVVVIARVARAIPSVESLPRPAPAFSRPHTTGPPRV